MIPASTRFLTTITLATTFLTLGAAAQTPAARITSAIENTARVTLTGTRPARALPANDLGALAPDTRLQGITLAFNRTAAQQSELDALIAAQQNPASPLFHQWLTPDQFGARFGMPAADIAAVQSWLQQQGFTLNSVSHSRDRITFSGTAAQVATAFGAEIHHFATPTGTHFAPASNLTIPAAIAPVVLTVTNLSDFKPHAHVVRSAKPDFTSLQTGNHFLTPLDVATIYDINTAYNTGYTGANQTIVIIGQSAVVTTDITSFQTDLGLPAKAPNLILMPNSGTSTIYADGDEAESDLDLEYSSSIAKGATVDFVYTGNSGSYGAFDALVYAVDNKLAPIISSSYGDCEPDLGAGNYAYYNAALGQAATQGQTVISAAGDDGSTDCYGISGDSTATQVSLAVDFPASSAFVTGLGGTEFPAADVASGNNLYFVAASTTDVVSSAVSYIPEQVWNDDSAANGISSGGGGVSIYTTRPSWQTGVSGVPTGFYRLVPDISLDSSAANAPYAFCTSDSSFWNTGQASSCSSGLRDSYSQDLTVAGGTSFAAPIFAGMLAIINQSLNNTTGQGVVNPTLYTLASNTTTYASAFHDITSGSNECLAGITYCTSVGASEYAATTGYDQASGLGSVDLNNLLKAWPAAIAASNRGSFKVAATGLTVASGSTGTSTVTVTPAGGYTGTIAWSLSASPALANACYTLPNTTVTSTSAVTATLTVTASSVNCPAAAVKGTMTNFAGTSTPAKPNHLPAAPVSIAAALLIAGCLSRSRRLRPVLALCVLAAAGFTLAGCSNKATGTTTSTTNNPTPVTNATAGTYTITVTGTDTVTSTITASTTFTLVID